MFFIHIVLGLSWQPERSTARLAKLSKKDWRPNKQKRNVSKPKRQPVMLKQKGSKPSRRKKNALRPKRLLVKLKKS